MRTQWGESIDCDDENRDYLRVGELKAAVSVDNMVFPPLCPSCLTPNPKGVYPITVPDGYRAGLLHPIYLPHCKRCSLGAGLFRGSGAVWAGLVASLVLAVAMLFFFNPFAGRSAQEIRTELIARGVAPTPSAMEVAAEEITFKTSTFVIWPYVPFFWLGLAGVILCAYLVHRKGIWVHTINEETAIFAFKHPEYCDEFRKANRITGVRKTTDELADWEARLCPFCNRPLQRGQELCSFCGRKAPAETAEMPKVEVGEPRAEGAHRNEHVDAAALETIEALAERATRSGLAIEEWPKTIRCQCGRKYRIRHPGTYHCVDSQCGRTFLVE